MGRMRPRLPFAAVPAQTTLASHTAEAHQVVTLEDLGPVVDSTAMASGSQIVIP